MRGYVTVIRRQVAFESSLESDFLTILGTDPYITDILEQPVRISYDGPTGRKKTYVPDYLARFGNHRADVPVLARPRKGSRTGNYVPPASLYNQTVLFEIKYRADLRANWSKLKPSFLAARRYAQENGWRFSIMTEVEIRGPYLDNMRFLANYRQRTPNPEIEEHLVRTIAILGETTPQAVLEAAYRSQENKIAAVGPLWRMLAIGRIHADLFQKLTMTTPMWVITGEGFL